jgi:hypothetical protein
MCSDERIHMCALVALTEDVSTTHFSTHRAIRVASWTGRNRRHPVLNDNYFQVEFSDRDRRVYAMLPPEQQSIDGFARAARGNADIKGAVGTVSRKA